MSLTYSSEPGVATQAQAPTGRRASPVWILTLIFFIVSIGSASLRADEQQSPPPRLPQRFAKQPAFTDALTVLRPQRARDWRELDRVEAGAEFALGRFLHQRHEFPAALRHYQRAWRLDADATVVLQEIAPLSWRLKHSREAVRYASLAVDSPIDDYRRVSELAMILSQGRHYAGAVKAYRRLEELEQAAAARLAIQFDLGRFYFLQQDYERSAQSFHRVVSVAGGAADNANSRPKIDKTNQAGESDAGVKPPQADQLSELQRERFVRLLDRSRPLLVESFLQAGRWDDAERLLGGDDIRQGNRQLQLQSARIDFHRGRIDDAWTQLGRVLKGKQPLGDAGPLVLLRDILGKKYSAAKAAALTLEQYRLLNDQRPGDGVIQHFLADQLMRMKRWREATKVYERVVKTQPTRESLLALVDIYLRQKQVPSLLDTLGRISMVTGSLGLLGDERRERMISDTMFTAFQRTLTTNGTDKPPNSGATAGRPNSPSNQQPAALAGRMVAFGLLALARDDAATANRWLQRAYESPTAPKAKIIRTWGLEMMLAAKSEHAVSVFRRGLADSHASEKHDLHFHLAGALADCSRFEEAVAAGRLAAQSNSGDLRFEIRPGWVYLVAGDLPPAEREYRRVLGKYADRYESEETRRLLREVRLSLARMASLQRRPHDAQRWLEEVLDEYPGYAVALNDLGCLWIEQGKHLHRSRRMIERVVAAEPNNPAFRDSLGRAYFHLGDNQKALHHLRRAARQDETDGVIFDHLGDVYNRLGKPLLALQAWQRADRQLDGRLERDRRQQVRRKMRGVEAAQPPAPRPDLDSETETPTKKRRQNESKD